MTANSITCEDIQRRIDEMSGNQLEQIQSHSVIWTHVLQCTVCEAYLDEARSLNTCLDQWEIPEPNRNICAGVMTEIAQLEKDKQRRLYSVWHQLAALFHMRFQVPAAAFSIMVLALAVSVFLNISMWQPTEQSPGFALNSEQESATPFNVTVPTLEPKQVLQVNTEGYSEIGSFLSQAQLTPSMYVIILGAPPVQTMDGFYRQTMQTKTTDNHL